MSFMNLVIHQMKRILKTPMLVVSIIILPVVVNFFVIFLNSNSHAAYGNYVIQVADEGDRWEGVITSSFTDYLVEDEEMDTQFEKLNSGEIAAIYHIPEDFSRRLEAGESPEVIRYTREGNSGDVLFENSIQENVKNAQVDAVLVQNGLLAENEAGPSLEMAEAKLFFQTEELDSTFATTIILMIFYILLNSSFISADMISFKKNNVLQRMVVSPNRDFSLITSMITAYTIFLFLTNVLVLLLSKLALGFAVSQMPLVICLLFLTCLFSLSFSFALFRLFKNEGVAQFVAMFYSIGSIFVTMLVQTGAENQVLNIISMFTPIHWVLEALDRNQFFPHVFILILMAAVLITAGSYKLKNYVKNA